MNDLIVLEEINVIAILSGEEDLDELLARIETEAKSLVPDLETDKGRKAIASNAAKVSSCKSYLDGKGKDYVTELKAKPKIVDGYRKQVRDFLDNLKAEVRKPLTEWENIEKERIENLENAIEIMSFAGINTLEQWMDITIENMRTILDGVEMTNMDWQEYEARAAEVKEAAISRIIKAIEKQEAYESEQVELEKLRRESAKREQKEREEMAAKEATKKAEKKAEETARLEKEVTEKKERKLQKAIQVAERAAARNEKLRIEAKEQAKRDAELAVKREQERIEQERKTEKEATKKREANKAHRSKINHSAKDALISVGLNEEMAKKVINAIAANEIPHISILY